MDQLTGLEPGGPKIAIFITSNFKQIWHPDQPKSLIVSSIVGGVNYQNSIVKMSVQMIGQPKCRQLLLMIQ